MADNAQPQRRHPRPSFADGRRRKLSLNSPPPLLAPLTRAQPTTDHCRPVLAITHPAECTTCLVRSDPSLAREYPMQNSDLDSDKKVNPLQIAILIFTLIVLGALTADTISHLPPQVSTLIHWLDTMACIVFFADFCVRFFRAKSKRAFIKWGWIDLLASIPYLPGLRYARLVRVLRVIRLLRGIRSVHRVLQMLFQQKAKTGAASLVLMAFLLVAFSSVSILICEQHSDGTIKSAEDAIWWSVTTVTTVGYGDKVPVTTEGRILAMALMIAGVGMFGGLSGLVASIFLSESDRRSSETREVLARLDALHVKLDALSRAGGRPPGALKDIDAHERK